MPLSAAERSKRYREKLNRDPKKRASYLEKCKIRAKKQKKIGEMSIREQRYQRKKWREHQQHSRWNKAKNTEQLRRLEENTPPPSPISAPYEPNRVSRRLLSNRRSTSYRRIKEELDTPQEPPIYKRRTRNHVRIKYTISDDEDTDNKKDIDLKGVVKNPHKYNGKTWTCEKCQTVFNDTKLWQRHRNKVDCEFKAAPKKKSKQAPWICKTCQNVFSNEKVLGAHRRQEHPVFKKVRPRPVVIEKYTFDEKQDVYTCSTCSAEFQTKFEVDSHLKLHNTHFSCTSCDEIFDSMLLLGLHSSKHNTDTKFSCPVSECSYTTMTKGSLNNHINAMHLKKFKHVCNVCGSGFYSKKRMMEHQYIHTGKRAYTCVVCGKMFTQDRYLLVHQIRYHQVCNDNIQLGMECGTCHLFFWKPGHFDKHIKTCVKKAKRPQSLMSHLCPTCGLNFVNHSKLKSHLNLHTKEQIYTCSYCKKEFLKKEYLKSHERVHTGYKPYSCEFCGKRFAHHGTFAVHRRTHTGARPYICDFCGRGHTTNQGRKIHQEKCKEKLV